MIDLINRDGKTVPFDTTIFSRFLAKMSGDLGSLSPALSHVDVARVVDRVHQGLFSGVTTQQLIDLCAESCASMTTVHPEYSNLAARVAMVGIHKDTLDSIKQTADKLYHFYQQNTGRHMPLISEETFDIMTRYEDILQQTVDYSRDFCFAYFGLKTLTRAYLLTDGKGAVIERPQHMLLRIAVGIHGNDIDRVIESYNLMSSKYFTHGSPTLFNAGTRSPQMSSCFLLSLKEDSIEGIFRTLESCAVISKAAGGIGLNIHNVRATGAYIAGSNGTSNGIVPMLRVYNNMVRYVDQGGNKRPGALAVYLEPWHADIFSFLDLRKNHGKDELRARDLFYALWIPDLFMQKVKDDENWFLFSPDIAPGLHEVYGKNFEDLYRKYVLEKKFQRKVPARELWRAILTSQIETGTPFMLYKDACNKKSNQNNLGTIKGGNLCTEIIQYSSPDEVAVCNLASIALPMFVETNHEGKLHFNLQKLHNIAKIVTFNLNRIIDINYYPLKEAQVSNSRHRPIAIGVQGLADAFFKLRLPAYDSEEAKCLNNDIFETIYHAAVEASIELAEKYGTYETYQGSPASQGLLQFDLWEQSTKFVSSLYDWDALKANMRKYGLRNSLLVGPMPTASTSQILGFSECFEPYTSNIYVRRVLSGEFQIVNQHLIEELTDLGIWSEELKTGIVKNGGSVKGIAEIPLHIQHRYRTVWEISQKSLIDMAADRGRFIDQSQSLNIYFDKPTTSKLTSMHFYAWEKGLKTGMYYLRTKAASQPQQITVANGQKTPSASIATKSTLSLKRKSSSTDLNSNSLFKLPSDTSLNGHIETADVHVTTPDNSKRPRRLSTMSRTRNCTADACDMCSG